VTTVMPESKLKKVLESGGKPDIDPINQLSSDKRELVTSPMEEKAKGMSVAQLGDAKQTKTIDRSMAPSSVAADAAKLPGTGLSGTQTETTPMMGQLPPGSGPGSASGGPGPGIGVPAPTTTPPPGTALPDITSAEQLKVGGLPVAWGGTLTVDANQAASKNKNNSGLCEFQIEYSVRNIGQSASGSFRSLWTNSAVTGNWTRVWTPVAAGGVKSEKDLVPLKPGRNQLQLVLDDLHQVKESNEANNTFHVNVNVTGSCATATGITPPAGTPLRR
jgi:hypothetical protein